MIDHIKSSLSNEQKKTKFSKRMNDVLRTIANQLKKNENKN